MEKRVLSAGGRHSLHVLFILTIGLVLLPFINKPTEAIGWKLFASAYTPDLDVHENMGAPGSVFAFTGSAFPSNSNAIIYVNNDIVGVVTTDGSGMGTFKIDTTGATDGLYNVVMAVDSNISALADFELDSLEAMVSPPAGFGGPTFGTTGFDIYLPVIQKN
jgi:hypothetical protein